MRSWRKVAMKVMVCQRPCGTLALIRAWRPAAQWRHVGSGPGLIDEHQTGGIDPVPTLGLLRPPTGDIGTILFGSNELPHRAAIFTQGDDCRFDPHHLRLFNRGLHRLGVLTLRIT